MLILTAVSFFLCLIQAPDRVMRLEHGLRKLLPPSSMAAVAELAGLPGVIFSGLLSRLGDRVCGVKMTELIQEGYPRFFRFCFGLFIILSFAAALAGNNDLFWPAFYAFWGVLVAIGWICRVCYIFLIKADSQEASAFRHYKKELMASRGRMAESGMEKAPASRKDGNEGVNWDWKFRQTLLNMAEYVRALLLQDHQDRLRGTARMWMEAFSSRSMPEWDETTYYGPDHYIFQDCALAASAWAALLPNGLASPHDVKILHSMLDHLDDPGDPGPGQEKVRHGCHSMPDRPDDPGDPGPGQERPRYGYSREVLLLGLAQFLVETSPRGNEQETKRLCSLTYGRQNRPADQDLICACLMMQTVEWLEDSAPAEGDLACAVYLLQPLLDNILLSTQSGMERADLAEFLYCAESIVRYAHCMDLSDFLLRVQRKLENNLETYGMSVHLCQKSRSPELLNCLLQRVSRSRNTAGDAGPSAAGGPRPVKASRRAAPAPAAESPPGEPPEAPAHKEAPGAAAEIPGRTRMPAYGEASGGIPEDLEEAPSQAAMGPDEARKKEV